MPNHLHNSIHRTYLKEPCSLISRPPKVIIQTTETRDENFLFEACHFAVMCSHNKETSMEIT